MARKKKNMIGFKMGVIMVVEELSSKWGHRRFVLECQKCKVRKNIYHSQLSTGEWSVCEHDVV